MNTIDLLKIKRKNFEKIKSIADRQEGLVIDDHIQEYLVLSAKRDLLKNEIESDHKKYRPVFEKADRKEKEMAMIINREISEVIESIMDIDKKIELMLTEKKNSYINEVKGLQKARTAVKSYGNRKKQPDPRFIKTVG